MVYLYDLQGQLIAEYQNGILKREYVWLDGAPLAQIDATAGGDSITWFTTDHLFTPRHGTDSSKEPVWQWDSYAFGETAPYLPTGSSGSMPTVNLRYPGQYFDSESNSYYNWHRYYDPNNGRYISSDAIGLEGGLNTFVYALSNALVHYDINGLKVYECWIGLHPTIKIESETDCDSKTDISGQWGFAPSEGNIGIRIVKGVWWQDGTVWSESGGLCRLVFDGDGMDQYIYDRIQTDGFNPPAYHLYWFNSIHWANYILYNGNKFNHDLALSAAR